MKTTLRNLNEALSFQMKGMYDAERKLQREIPKCSVKVRSEALKGEIGRYIDSTDDKILKLERIFSYLMTEPSGVKNEIIDKFIEDTHKMLQYASSDDIRDVVFIACIQNINHYKIATYGTALAFAIELKLNTVADLLHEILEWEKDTDRALTKISLEEMNGKEATIH